ncbi:MAG: deoxyribonuclease IV [Clostridia bacterium]|nr:deoxyribonuclease IV [Clostridia bacterium]
MFYIGCHLSVSQGYAAMGRTALSIGANTFQYFTRNPRGRGFRRPAREDIEALNKLISENGFAPPLAHAPYTFNPASAEDRIWSYSRDSMREDLEVLEDIPGALYNFHPGCHVGIGAEAGIENTARLLSEVITPGQGTRVLIETMAGKGSEIGKTFEEIRAIIDSVDEDCKSHVGVCLDTCHISDGGYDIIQDTDAVLETFDTVIGLDRLCAIHLNDSKNPLGAAKDRHEKIGEGFLGLEGIARVINHPLISHLPFYLETPNELDGYEREIALLKSLRK